VTAVPFRDRSKVQFVMLPLVEVRIFPRVTDNGGATDDAQAFRFEAWLCGNYGGTRVEHSITPPHHAHLPTCFRIPAAHLEAARTFLTSHDGDGEPIEEVTREALEAWRALSAERRMASRRRFGR
jgi:hypothetical protein